MVEPRTVFKGKIKSVVTLKSVEAKYTRAEKSVYKPTAHSLQTCTTWDVNRKSRLIRREAQTSTQVLIKHNDNEERPGDMRFRGDSIVQFALSTLGTHLSITTPNLPSITQDPLLTR